MARGYVVARDPKRNRILIGGLGVFQVGQMWKDETKDDKTRQNYETAEIADSEGQ